MIEEVKSWKYSQSTGDLTSPEGAKISRGYSGNGPGRNNPNLQNVRGVGPIPQGLYQIGWQYMDGQKGPCVMRLLPFQDTETFGRDGFLIHGDSIKAPGSASHGCIILGRPIREHLATSKFRNLEVTA